MTATGESGFEEKSTVQEIRRRFDQDVERFSSLETGQAAAMDSPLQLSLIAEAAAETTPHARTMLDIGAGAGNYTLTILQRLNDLDCALLDLSRPMLDRAVERVSAATRGEVEASQGDVRRVDLGRERYDLVVAAQCLHHLRHAAEWRDVFERVFASLRPGGSFWICDSLSHASAPVERMMWRRWGEYLTALKDEAYRDHVLAYVEKEDTPRPLVFQLELMRRVGFERVDVLHKHGRFGSFGGVKP